MNLIKPKIALQIRYKSIYIKSNACNKFPVTILTQTSGVGKLNDY